MTLVVLYFAALRELLGIPEETLHVELETLPAGTPFTVARLAERLVSVHPELEGRLASVRFAVNESFADAADPVRDGDTIAVIPPVSGG
jgi:molybdopterin synthase sulfur carrier subunit